MKRVAFCFPLLFELLNKWEDRLQRFSYFNFNWKKHKDEMRWFHLSPNLDLTLIKPSSMIPPIWNLNVHLVKMKEMSSIQKAAVIIWIACVCFMHGLFLSRLIYARSSAINSKSNILIYWQNRIAIVVFSLLLTENNKWSKQQPIVIYSMAHLTTNKQTCCNLIIW